MTAIKPQRHKSLKPEPKALLDEPPLRA